MYTYYFILHSCTPYQKSLYGSLGLLWLFSMSRVLFRGPWPLLLSKHDIIALHNFSFVSLAELANWHPACILHGFCLPKFHPLSIFPRLCCSFYCHYESKMLFCSAILTVHVFQQIQVIPGSNIPSQSKAKKWNTLGYSFLKNIKLLI